MAEDYQLSKENWTPIEDVWDRSDLDRCVHGRHSTDPCFNCPGGQSAGNLYLEDGARIGTTLYGEPIVVQTKRSTE
jgi:hypothetical protein